MMPVAAEVYSAGACARGHLQRVILACSSGTSYSGLDLYDIGSSIGFNSGLHRFVDEIRPFLPVALVAGALHTNEKTPRMPVKRQACQQVSYCAIANQGFWHHGACPLASSRQPAMRSSCVSTTDVVSTQTSVLHTERRQSDCTYRLEPQIAIVICLAPQSTQMPVFQKSPKHGFD